MFQYLFSHGYDMHGRNASVHLWKYDIHDTDFIVQNEVVSLAHIVPWKKEEARQPGGLPGYDKRFIWYYGIAAVAGVIHTYTNRKLNVPANIAAALMWYGRYGDPIKLLIEKNNEYNPHFAQYKDEITKYLVLM